MVRLATFGLALILTAGSSVPAGAQIRGEIIGAGATLMPIAVPDLKRMSETANATAAAEFVRVLRHDLELLGLFRVIDLVVYIDDL